MLDFRKLLKGMTKAADLAKAISEAEGALERARADHATLVEARGTLMLDGSDEQIQNHETRQQSAVLMIERLEAGLAALHQKKAETQAAEEKARVDAVNAEGEQVQQIGVVELKEYERSAEETARHLRRVEAADELIKRRNADLAAAGDPRRVATSVEVMACYTAHGAYRTDLLDQVHLPCVGGQEKYGTSYWTPRSKLQMPRPDDEDLRRVLSL